MVFVGVCSNLKMHNCFYTPQRDFVFVNYIQLHNSGKNAKACMGKCSSKSVASHLKDNRISMVFLARILWVSFFLITYGSL